MKLSDKAQEALDLVVEQFKSGDLSPIVELARIQRLGEPIPSEQWTLSNRVLALIQTGSMDCRGYRQCLLSLYPNAYPHTPHSLPQGVL